MTSQKFEHAELPFGHTGRRSDDTLDPDYNPDDGDVVHYAPGTGRYAATRAGARCTPTIPPGWLAAKDVWSSSTKTWADAGERTSPKAEGRPEALPALRESRMVKGGQRGSQLTRPPQRRVRSRTEGRAERQTLGPSFCPPLRGRPRGRTRGRMKYRTQNEDEDHDRKEIGFLHTRHRGSGQHGRRPVAETAGRHPR